MRRKRLAVALACLLGLLASGLVGVFAFLELSPRDYRMVWLLRRTKTIEVTSSWWKNGRIVEITDPREVARIVAAMTVKLDRTREEIGESSHRARFVLEDGSDVVAELGTSSSPWLSRVLLRRGTLAGVHTTSGGALEEAFEGRGNAYLDLGLIEVGGRELNVRLAVWEIARTRSYALVAWHPAVRERGDIPEAVEGRLVWRDGASTTLSWGSNDLRGEAEKLYEDLLRVELTSGGRTWSFPAPTARYDAEAARLWK